MVEPYSTVFFFHKTAQHTDETVRMNLRALHDILTIVPHSFDFCRKLLKWAFLVLDC